MRNPFIVVIVLTCLLFSGVGAQAQEAAGEGSIATCTFEDEKEMSVRYTPPKSSEKVPNGKIWAPGGKPMLLFTQTDIMLGNSPIPVGAYTMYTIPGKSSWTVIVSKNVDPAAKYDEKQDIARAQMDIGQLSSEEPQFSVVFGRVGPKKCAMRFYFGKIGAFVDFDEK